MATKPAMSLRPYQADALGAVRKVRDSGGRRMVVVMPTGGGKTIVFSHLSEALGLGQHEKVLILAHREELVSQAREKYLSVNPHEMVGIEKAESRATPMDRVAIASVQSLRGNRLDDFLSRFGYPSLVITDEVHHAMAPMYQGIYDACGIASDGDVVHVGVTATPKRADKIGLQGSFDTIAYSIGLGELIDLGFLVPLVGYQVQTRTNLDSVRTTAGDFNQGDLSEAVDTDERNARVVSAYADIAPMRKALVFAASVAHSQDLRDAFIDAGFTARHVDGTTPVDERRAILSDYKRGKFNVLTNCNVLSEGFDEPLIECVVIAKPSKSPVLVAQMIGRATRLHPGKKNAVIIDIVDVTKRHSIVSLPTLFGMPANFDLKGKDANEAGKKFTRLASETPEVSGMVSDAAALDAMLAKPANERVRGMIAEMLDKARKTQTYVDVDLLRPVALDDEVRAVSSMSWLKPTDDMYRLRLNDDSIAIKVDLVGGHEVSVSYLHEGEKRAKALGTFDSRDAFAVAEQWMRTRNPESCILVDRNAGWRSAKASDKQIEALRKFRVANPERLTRGDASSMLDMLISAKRQRVAS